MARSRNIKPGLFKNEGLGILPVPARFLFPGLWVLSDREGRLEDRPARIAAEIFPYDRDIGAAEVDSWLTALAESSERFILRYSVGGSAFIQITNFLKHQSPHIKEQGSVIPAPDMHQTRTGHAPDEHSPRQCAAPPESLIPPSLIPPSLNADESQNHSPSAAADGGAIDPTTPVVAVAIAVQELFDEFWDLFWRKDGKKAAREKFGDKVKTGADWARMKAALLRQRPKMMARDQDYRPQAATWLKGDRMHDEESPPPITTGRAENVHDRNQRRRDNVNALTKTLLKKSL